MRRTTVLAVAAVLTAALGGMALVAADLGGDGERSAAARDVEVIGVDAVGQGDGQSTADGTPDRAVVVTGEGSAEASPDRAVVSVAVVAEGDDPAAIRDRLRDDADALRGALEAADVPLDRLETTEYRIDERHRFPYEEADRDPPTYRGIHAFRVTLDDVDEAGSVVDAAADVGAQIQFVSFELSDQRRAELRDRALTAAMDDARRQADTLAAAGDLTVIGVRRVDASDRRFIPVPERAVEDVGQGTVFQPGDVTLMVTVHVTYDVAEAGT